MKFERKDRIGHLFFTILLLVVLCHQGSCLQCYSCLSGTVAHLDKQCSDASFDNPEEELSFCSGLCVHATASIAIGTGGDDMVLRMCEPTGVASCNNTKTFLEEHFLGKGATLWNFNCRACNSDGCNAGSHVSARYLAAIAVTCLVLFAL